MIQTVFGSLIHLCPPSSVVAKLCLPNSTDSNSQHSKRHFSHRSKSKILVSTVLVLLSISVGIASLTLLTLHSLETTGSASAATAATASAATAVVPSQKPQISPISSDDVYFLTFRSWKRFIGFR